eukprot:m.143807 g.143807  ORF g.143807 m.143807 type:complete len:206 (+) comp14105_c0_seq3:376-993(+)
MFVTASEKFATLEKLVHAYSLHPYAFACLLREPIINEALFKQRNIAISDLDADDLEQLARPMEEGNVQGGPGHLSGDTAQESQLGIRYAGWLSKLAGNQAQQTQSSSWKSALRLGRRNWQSRWFVLQDTMLKYFRSKFTGKEAAAGYLNICPDTRLHCQTESTFAIETPRRTLMLNAKTKQVHVYIFSRTVLSWICRVRGNESIV